MKNIFRTVVALAVIGFVGWGAYHLGAKRAGDAGAGVFLAFAEGKVQVSSDGHTWTDAGVGEKVTAGQSVRTGEGRAVVVFGDGSVARLDKDTEMAVVQTGQTVLLENKEGRVYNRVNPDDGLSWTMLSLGTSITAKGTAFTVACDKTKKELAVLVTESKVEVKVEKDDGTFKAEVAKGKEMKLDLKKAVYESAETKEVEEDDLRKDEFVAWNMSEDENLGESTVTAEAGDVATTTAIGDDNEEAETALVEKAGEAEKKPEATTPKTVTAPVSKIVLSAVPTDKGVKFTWTVSGVSAPHGFKLTKSLEPNPYYPRDPYLYLSSPDARSATWEIKDGKTWHFRVCTWNGGAGGESKCIVHSNDVSVKTVAKMAETKKESASPFLPIANELVLTAVKTDDGARLSWTQSSAESFQGYKVVRSKDNADPYYPRDGYLRYITTRSEISYLDTTAEAGESYYYRICALKSSETTVCGNVVHFSN